MFYFCWVASYKWVVQKWLGGLNPEQLLEYLSDIEDYDKSLSGNEVKDSPAENEGSDDSVEEDSDEEDSIDGLSSDEDGNVSDQDD